MAKSKSRTATARSVLQAAPISRREANKAERRRNILNAATLLFEAKGFQKTTMDVIAEKAGVGVATVYKYFQSKEGILYEISQPQLEAAFAEGEKIIADPPEDPAQAISMLISCYTRIQHNWQDRNILRAVSVPGMMANSGLIDEIINQADARAEQQIRDLLRVLQLRGRISKSANVTNMATIIFAVFNHEYLVYVTHDDVSARNIFAKLNRLMKTLFEPW